MSSNSLNDSCANEGDASRTDRGMEAIFSRPRTSLMLRPVRTAISLTFTPKSKSP